MYLILMYLIPVTQFLNDVPTSDVSKSVTSFCDVDLRASYELGSGNRETVLCNIPPRVYFGATDDVIGGLF